MPRPPRGSAPPCSVMPRCPMCAPLPRALPAAAPSRPAPPGQRRPEAPVGMVQRLDWVMDRMTNKACVRRCVLHWGMRCDEAGWQRAQAPQTVSIETQHDL